MKKRMSKGVEDQLNSIDDLIDQGEGKEACLKIQGLKSQGFSDKVLSILEDAEIPAIHADFMQSIKVIDDLLEDGDFSNLFEMNLDTVIIHVTQILHENSIVNNEEAPPEWVKVLSLEGERFFDILGIIDFYKLVMMNKNKLESKLPYLSQGIKLIENKVNSNFLDELKKNKFSHEFVSEFASKVDALRPLMSKLFEFTNDTKSLYESLGNKESSYLGNQRASFERLKSMVTNEKELQDINEFYRKTRRFVQTYSKFTC